MRRALTVGIAVLLFLLVEPGTTRADLALPGSIGANEYGVLQALDTIVQAQHDFQEQAWVDEDSDGLG